MNIAEKEAEIKAFKDPSWYWLVTQRRAFVAREKEAAKEEAVKNVIDEGYANFLDSIIEVAKKREA